MNIAPTDGVTLMPGFVDGDGIFELAAYVRAGTFGGASSAWFNRSEIRTFANRLGESYPLSSATPIELVGGYIGGSPDGTEAKHVHLRFYAVGGRGIVGCSVRLATPISRDERPLSQHTVSVEFLTTYSAIDLFCKQLIALAENGQGEAHLAATEH